MSKGSIHKAALACAALAVLASCGNETTDQAGSPFVIAAKTVGEAVAARRTEDKAPAKPPKSPAEKAAEALRVNPNPLIMAGFESLGRSQVMAMTDQNGGMRTYMTPSEEALIMRNGMLVGTRGLGDDLSVAEPGTAGLIRAGRSGSATRVMRYFSGDGLERPLSFDCDVGPGPKAGVIVESCQGHGVSFQNSFMLQGGQIPVSRQWIGPALGYVTIQTLRP
ncbi:YjbF family lipoprotein [Paracoccus saliphilus]|uniref:Group 4 capsule polysaccharide lipoprotein gfcB, YjbF n=1 Tax=Paracoccus saliphilus TaxID=405559 RepID=A0AA45W6T2_9RHOB|nr:YjbF family lipoprotein [Paracoccus saliphilus]WCR03767.1 YjbF family lipoprotein [Paracoccus saliphilus]SIT04488.1 Group 4 capsule polysaccharide lipoprotein gfcB, YjbF [Paracoccus saliphilus]